MLSIKCANVQKLADVTASGTELQKAIRLGGVLNWLLNKIVCMTSAVGLTATERKLFCNLMGPNGTFVKWNTDEATRDALEWDNQGEASNKGISFSENRDMVFPIPLYEITMSNGSIVQNPGWN